MVKAKFQVKNGEQIEWEYDQDFTGEADMYSYLQAQNEHPFLTIELVEIISK